MNKIIKTLFLSSIILVTLSSCNKKEEGESKDVEAEIPISVVEIDEPIKFECTYKESSFNKPATRYSKDLSMLSLAYAYSSSNINRLNRFYDDLGFETLYITNNYDDNRSEDYDSYSIGLKEYKGFNLYCVSTRGFAYKEQFSANFELGLEGNAYGFDKNVSIIYQSLKDHIDTSRKAKIWLSGYSRAGALMNMLATNILSKQEINIKEDDLYVYTFEAPASIDEANALAYENVHNINNEVDLITFIPPQTYGLKRCGVDYPIYDADVSTLIKEFDEEIVIPEFVPVEDLTEEPLDSDAKVRDFIINTVFNKKEDEYTDPSVYANTRAQYVDNYQEGLSIALGYVFALKEATRASLLADLTALGLGALSIIGDETGVELMNFFKPYLERDGITYNEEELLSACAILIKGVQNLFLAIILMYVGDQTKGSITRLIDMHYPETTYVLLKNAHQKAQTIE